MHRIRAAPTCGNFERSADTPAARSRLLHRHRRARSQRSGIRCVSVSRAASARPDSVPTEHNPTIRTGPAGMGRARSEGTSAPPGLLLIRRFQVRFLGGALRKALLTRASARTRTPSCTRSTTRTTPRTPSPTSSCWTRTLTPPRARGSCRSRAAPWPRGGAAQGRSRLLRSRPHARAGVVREVPPAGWSPGPEAHRLGVDAAGAGRPTAPTRGALPRRGWRARSPRPTPGSWRSSVAPASRSLATTTARQGWGSDDGDRGRPHDGRRAARVRRREANGFTCRGDVYEVRGVAAHWRLNVRGEVPAPNCWRRLPMGRNPVR